jgi:hypothetical protein
MYRLIAKITKARKKPQRKLPQGASAHRFSLDVEVEGPAFSGVNLPHDVKGARLTIERETLFASEFEVGNKIVLTEDECRSLITPAELPPVIEEGSESVRLVVHDRKGDKPYKVKVDGQGVKAKLRGALRKSKADPLWREATIALETDPDRRPGEVAFVKVTLESDAAAGQGKDKKPIEVRAAILPKLGRAGSIAYTADVDSDGHPEVVLDNGWLQATVSPARGAAITSIRGPGGDQHIWRGLRTEEGRELDSGGATDHTSPRSVPGEVAQQAFAVSECRCRVSEAPSCAFRGQLKKNESVTYSRRITALPIGPLLLVESDFHYSGKKKDEKKTEEAREPGEQDEDKFRLRFCSRIPARPVPGDLEDLVIWCSTAKGVEGRRYRRPDYDWGDYPVEEFFGLRYGCWAAWDDEQQKGVYALFDAGIATNLRCLFYEECASLLTCFEEAELKKDEQRSFALLVGRADRACVEKDAAAFATFGHKAGRRLPVSVVAMSVPGPDEATAVVAGGKSRTRLRLDRTFVPRVGRIFCGSATVEVAPTELPQVTVTLGGTRLRPA